MTPHRQLRWAIALLLCAAAMAAEDVLVANPSVSIDGLDQVMLRDVFLGRRTTWPNGQRVVVVLLRDGAANERLGSELGKTPQQLINWWKRLVFTGEGNMPELVSTRDELITRVAGTPGAVGWVERGEAAPQNLKILVRR